MSVTKNVSNISLNFCFRLSYYFSGIALLSMSIQLMQEEIVGKIRWLASSIGMGAERSGEEMVKVSKVSIL